MMTEQVFKKIASGLEEAALIAPYLAEVERLVKQGRSQRKKAARKYSRMKKKYEAALLANDALYTDITFLRAEIAALNALLGEWRSHIAEGDHR